MDRRNSGVESRPLKKTKVKSVNHALRLLNKAAGDSSDEIKTMLSKDFSVLKNLLAEAKPTMKKSFNEIAEVTSESVSHMRDQVVDTTKEAARAIDKSAHDHPWYFVGGVAALSAIFTYSLLRKSRD